MQRDRADRIPKDWVGIEGAMEAYADYRESFASRPPQGPIPVVIDCPRCGCRHIDEGEWATKPHKTHQCQSCKHEWRPFEVPTVGVWENQFVAWASRHVAETTRDAVEINRMCAMVHKLNEKWWRGLHSGEPIDRNVGELLMLAVTELAEAMEGHRKNLPDDKLPHRPMFEVELADCVIRIFDIAYGLGCDLGGAFVEKLEYNKTRADHSEAERLKTNGKKY